MQEQPGGLYRSTNSGSGFLFNNSFSPSKNVRGICKEAGKDFVYVVTEEAIYKCWDSYIVGIEDPSTIEPQSFQLYQNYPNPFNPKTVIRYSLFENRFVGLKVFDVIGNEVAELVNETRRAGKYDVEFDGNNISSGVYFYSLYIDGIHVDTKRMLLLK
ncbi:MAG: T9SS type A sorting domain-containing protein [Ignavibacteria bacterium]|nr:T9SS type A sorting domain-containing protein [Ignavibacteria bacterium]